MIKDRNKIERNLRLLEKAIVEIPDEPSLLMSHGLELTRSGKPEAGLEQYEKAFDRMSALPGDQVVPETRETLLAQLTTRLMAGKLFGRIIHVLTSPLAKAGGLTASLHFTLGLAHLELRQLREAAEQMRQCLAKRDKPSLAPINPEVRKAGPRHCLAMCLAQLGDAEAAEKEFQQALEDDPQSWPLRFDYARFLADHDRPVEALNLYFALATEKPDEPQVWLAGGQLALSKPGLLEVALDWTAQAQLQMPNNSAIVRQRAEALTLAGQCAEALPLWQKLQPGSDPARFAAVVLCETVMGENKSTPPADLELSVSRELLSWYPRLLRSNARATIETLNAHVDALRSVLPSAGRLVAAALEEAGERAESPIAGGAPGTRDTVNPAIEAGASGRT